MCEEAAACREGYVFFYTTRSMGLVEGRTDAGQLCDMVGLGGANPVASATIPRQ